MSTPHHLKNKKMPKKRTSATAGSCSDSADSRPASPPTAPVARHCLDTDMYAPPDVASSGAEVETHESLLARDPDNKLPIMLNHRQMDDLVEFVEARLIFYDKKSMSWLNTNNRLSILKEWADAEVLNGTSTRFCPFLKINKNSIIHIHSSRCVSLQS